MTMELAKIREGLEWPPYPKWLGPSFDQWAQQDPELIPAYDWPDYPGPRKGEGNWVELYLDEAGKFPVGVVWLSPEHGSVGIIPAENGNYDYVAKSVLELREMFRHEVSPFAAYDYIKGEYYCGEEETGDLKDVGPN